MVLVLSGSFGRFQGLLGIRTTRAFCLTCCTFVGNKKGSPGVGPAWLKVRQSQPAAGADIRLFDLLALWFAYCFLQSSSIQGFASDTTVYSVLKVLFFEVGLK